MGEEFYPMPVFVNLEVADIQASVIWYRDALGFRVVYQMPSHDQEGPAMVHLRRAIYQDVLLFPRQSVPTSTPGQGVVVNFLPGDVSVDDIAKNVLAAGSGQVVGPVEQPWNVREITVTDPDGYRLRFSEPIDVTRSFEDVMGGADSPS